MTRQISMTSVTCVTSSFTETIKAMFNYALRSRTVAVKVYPLTHAAAGGDREGTIRSLQR